MGQDVDYQCKPGRTQPCCVGMKNATRIGYIQKGFLWYKWDPPKWFNWQFRIDDARGYDESDIDWCPFCGRPLNDPEEV